MCGFAGFTGTDENSDLVLTNMMNKIIHRGPDSEGKHIDSNVAFGFRRLSIIGLEDGSQPMYNEDRSIVLVFNGEIYNYQTLKAELIEKGHIFSNSSDSEVLIHAYEEYGTGMLEFLRGMFAFAIYDTKNDTLFLVRDFFGIKPFYYSFVDNHLIFGSEIKSILEHPSYEKEMNLEALETYLNFQCSVLPETFFKGIFKLPPAHYAIYKDGKLDIKRYWEPKFEEIDKPYEEFVDQIDETIQNSIQMHKISDVEVGSFLSSGVDSSYVAACFNGDKTFTVGFDYEKYNEIDYAKALSEKVGIDNFSKIITTDEYWETLPKVQYHMDEPLADPSAVALYFVSQVASEHVKVAMSGEGADELFGGYNIYQEPFALHKIQKLPKPVRKAMAGIVRALPFKFKGKNFLIRASKSLEERYIGNAFMFSVKEKNKLMKNAPMAHTPRDITQPVYDKVKGKDDITRMQYLDLHVWLVSDILLKADKMSMAHSLEVRVPYMDKEICKLATTLPLKYRTTPKVTKIAMREAANRHLPKEVSDKKKLGFPVPIRIWLRDKKYYNIVKEVFTSNVANEYFNEKVLLKYLNDHFNEKADNSRKIWTVYMFLIWHKIYFE
ncbi:MAG: hypothetical protein K0R15_1359 [Clostridiales bacterium]|jgi:asparagine synthase (glutamine-hydrolysing)|nr:hypothetical protein [Clostridiales bacterium]